MLAAVILAAGESRRMGTPKALLRHEGRTFLERLLEASRQPKIGLSRVVLGAHADRVQPALNLAPDAVVINPEWKKGQLSSINVALKSLLPGATDGIVLFLVDHPFVTAALVEDLIEAFYSSGKAIVVPTYKGKRGHPVIFSSRLYDELLTAPTDVGARAVVWAHESEVLEVPTDEEGVVLNLNDPEALRRALGTGNSKSQR